jgi:Ca2+-binding RTX toxin-like protein
MAIMTGTNEQDFLTGTDGNDTIEGLDGNDSLDGGFGDDIVRGGAGNDYIYSRVGSDTIEGGTGNDNIRIEHRDGGTTNVDAGDDDDIVTVFNWGSHVSKIDMGAGADFIEMISNADGGRAELTLGGGRDAVSFQAFYGATTSLATGTVIIKDFETGAQGDRLDWLGMLSSVLTGWDGAANPFATGHVRLIQLGADALLQIDRDGGANSFFTFITFENVLATAFTMENLDGFPTDGSVPSNLVFTGTEGEDALIGSAGADLMEGVGGDDRLDGGTGGDTIRGGDGADDLYGEYGADILEGGEGNDYIDGGKGADEISGGGGSDYLTDLDGDDVIDGGDGDDRLYLARGSRHPSDIVTGIGGEGNDSITLHSISSSRFIVDAGAGDDNVSILILAGLAEVSLGAGTDKVTLEDFSPNYLLYQGSLVIADFQSGAGGDVVTLDKLPHATYGDNPFANGLRLVQSGADTVLQTGGSDYWRTFITFKNTDAASFTAENFGGFAPDGSPPPGQTLDGTEFSDLLQGGAGDDVITGRAGQDSLHGFGGDDVIDGGADGDYISGGAGNDRIDAGDGDDRVDDGRGDDIVNLGAGNDSILSDYGSDTIDGGEGDDHISVQRQSNSGGGTIKVTGGAGNDRLDVFNYGGAIIDIDAGAGDDTTRLHGIIGQLTITLGTGTDTLDFGSVGFPWYQSGTITVTDFAAGAQGDRLLLNEFASRTLVNWTPGTNPFTTGHLRFAQAGPDARLEIDRDGAGGDFVLLATFRNVRVSSLTVDNIGYELPSITGTADHDVIAGTVYGDLFRMEQGGDDEVSAGEDRDAIYFGAALTQGDSVDGGGDIDQLAIQGNYTGGNRLVLGAVTNVEQLVLLSGTDTRFGASGAGLYSYDVTTADRNVAAGQQMQIDGVRLRAGENFIFDGSAETDGSFLVWAGKGTDVLKGGAGNDGFLFRGNGNWSAADSVDGGAGSDQLGIRGNYAGANAVTFAWNQITSIETLALMSGTDTRFGAAIGDASYDITMHDGNLAAGGRMTVDATFLRSGETLVFNGGSESDGSFRIFGGQASDFIAGSQNGDSIRGGLGGDSLFGGSGADIFVYRSAADSTGLAFDRLLDFSSAEDKLDLASTVSGSAGTVGTGRLDAASFNADLVAALDEALGANQAILFNPDSGSFAGRRFLVVDGNGDGAYTEGADYVFELAPGASVDLTGTAFFV